MTTIMEQQVELDLGDEFKPRLFRTKNFVAGLMNKGWFENIDAVYRNEGDLVHMAYHCLMYQITEDDTFEGYRAYTKYLLNLYGANYPDNAAVSLQEYTGHTSSSWVTIGEWATNDPSVPNGLSESIDETAVNEEDFSLDEQDIMRAHHLTNSVQETADIMGISHNEVTRRVDNVRRKAVRRTP